MTASRHASSLIPPGAVSLPVFSCQRLICALRVCFPRAPFALIFLLAAALSGCSAYQSPNIDVRSPRVTEKTGEAIAIAFPLRLENPNADPIELQHFEYALTVDGQTVYHGRRAAQMTLHRNGDSSVELPAVIAFQRVGWSAESHPAEVTYRLSGSLLYTTPGELAQTLLDTGVRRPTAHFSVNGAMTLDTNVISATNPDVP